MSLLDRIDAIERNDVRLTELYSNGDNEQLLNDFIHESKNAQQDSIDQSETSLFSKWKSKNWFVKLTNFTEDEILSILRCIQPFTANTTNERGRKCKVSWSDGILMLILFYKTNMDITELSAFVDRSYHLVQNAIYKSRHILHVALTKKWLQNPNRPSQNQNSMFPYIGVCYDHTSF